MELTLGWGKAIAKINLHYISCWKMQFFEVNIWPRISLLYEKVEEEREPWKLQLNMHCDLYFILHRDPFKHRSLCGLFECAPPMWYSMNVVPSGYHDRHRDPIKSKMYRTTMCSFQPAQLRGPYEHARSILVDLWTVQSIHNTCGFKTNCPVCPSLCKINISRGQRWGNNQI